MKVLAFRHVPFEGLGTIEPILRERDIEIEYADLYRPDASVPDPTTADGLIFMGGPMSANDDLAWLKWEIDALAAALARRQPVLGVCLGAQLMAKAAGAAVYRNPVKEIGWYPIRLTGDGLRDPLFCGLAADQMVFQWHGDTFDLPGGSSLLASSEACRHQAYRLRDAAYGLQFHLEVTPEMIVEWCQQDANCGDLCELSGPIEVCEHTNSMKNLARFVFDRWAGLL